MDADRPIAAPQAAVRVAVCACTFRRPEGLAALLDGLRGQRFERIAAPEVLVLIVDNEGSSRSQAICEAAASRGLGVRYLAETRRGISFARNRGLDAVPEDVDFIAMIDDDERPEPDWLEELLLAQAATGADVVQGRVRPAFAPGAPAWIRDGGFFGYPLPSNPFRDNAWSELGGGSGRRHQQRPDPRRSHCRPRPALRPAVGTDWWRGRAVLPCASRLGQPDRLRRTLGRGGGCAAGPNDAGLPLAPVLPRRQQAPRGEAPGQGTGAGPRPAGARPARPSRRRARSAGGALARRAKRRGAQGPGNPGPRRH